MDSRAQRIAGLVECLKIGLIKQCAEADLRWLLEVVNELVAELAKADAAQAWIPVTERMPEDGQSILVYIPGYEDAYLGNRVAWVDFDTNPPEWVFNGMEVDGATHWMPLPAPPETTEEEKQ